MIKYDNKKKSTGISLFLLILFLVIFVQGCSLGKERYEMTKYDGSTIKYFQRRSGEKPILESNGVYRIDNELQLLVSEDKITSIMILPEAKEYSLYGVRIGTPKEEAEKKISEVYGQEVSKVINTEKDCVVYTYLSDKNEVYVSFGLDSDAVMEISYYNGTENKQEQAPQENNEPVNAGELILIVGGTRVYYNEVMVYLKSVQDKYEETYGPEIWSADIFGDGSRFGDHIKDEIIKQITELKVINAKAKELEITLTEEELSEARKYAIEHLRGISDTDIDRYLITKELLEKVYTENLLAEKVYETKTINVDTTVSAYDTRQITVQHVLIYNTDFDSEGNPIQLTAEEKQKALEKAEGLLVKAKEANDFREFAEANSESKDIEFTFGRGQGPKEYNLAFEQAAFTLRTGQVSNLVVADYGWHIIYCVTDSNEEATIRRTEQIIESRRTELFARLYGEWSAEFDVIVNNEVWKAVFFES